MYIALIAAPGSGKTTLAKETERVLNEEYEIVSTATAPLFIPGRSLLYRLGWLVYGWLYFDRALFRLYFRFTGMRNWYRQRGIQNKLWRLYIPIVSSYYLQQKQATEIAVVVDDESALGRYQVVAVKDSHADTLDAKFVAAFSDTIIDTYGKVLVVEIDTPPAVAAKRRVVRDGLEIAEWDEYVSRKEQSHQRHKALVEKIGASFSDETVTVMTVDGTKAPEVLAKEVAEKVMEIGEFGVRGEG